LQLQDEVVAFALDYWVAWQTQNWRDEREKAKWESLAEVAPLSPPAMVEMMN